MKIKILLLLAFVFPLSGCQKTQYFVPLGNFSTHLVDEMSKAAHLTARNYFTSEKMQSGELFKIADSNASFLDGTKKHTFINTIEKAKSIVIAIGLEDVVPSLTIDENLNTIDYDDDLIAKQMEILDYHLVHVIDAIRYVTAKADVFVLGTYSTVKLRGAEAQLYKGIIANINKTLMEASSQNRAKYISLLALEERSQEDNFNAMKDELTAEIVGAYL